MSSMCASLRRFFLGRSDNEIGLKPETIFFLSLHPVACIQLLCTNFHRQRNNCFILLVYIKHWTNKLETNHSNTNHATVYIKKG
jgi:hypothetical protein